MTVPEKTVHVIISGRVQGVWYRAWTKENATALGLSGFVRNRLDGTVEAVFSGPAKDVDDMLARCANGPPHADVSGIEILAPSQVASGTSGDSPRSEWETGSFLTRPTK